MFVEVLISHSDTDTHGRNSNALPDRRRAFRYKDANSPFYNYLLDIN